MLSTPFRHALIACFVLGVYAPLSAQTLPELPDTHAGRQAAALLTALRGNEADRRAFISESLAPDFREQFPLEMHLRQLSRMADDLRGARAVGVDVPGPNEIMIEFETTSGERLRLGMALEVEPPHRIVGIGVDAGSGTRDAIIEFSDYASLDGELTRLAAEDRFAGVVLVARDNQIAFHRAYGLADREADTPVRLDTRFNIGSLNKAFTSVAILRLAQDGHLDLDSPIERYLDGLRPEVAGRVTARHLLQHSSGMGDFLMQREYRRDPTRFVELSDFLALVRDQPLEFEPGARTRYSNSGYIVLGGVIEAVTRRKYGDVIHDLIFEPAGMTATSLEGRAANPNTATGYSRELAGGNRPVRNDVSLPGRASSAGGGYATAIDLAHFARALVQNSLLRREWTDVFLNRFEPTAEGRRPGWIGLGGGAPGINAVMEFEVVIGDAIIVLANLDPPIAEEVAEAMRSQLAAR